VEQLILKVKIYFMWINFFSIGASILLSLFVSQNQNVLMGNCQSSKNALCDTTKITDNILLQYADSVSKVIAEGKLPKFLLNECLDQDPTIFVGFHGSFRWEVLQKVTNISPLKYLMDSHMASLKKKCKNNKSREILYDNLSFYQLIELRYKELNSD
jgi:hypothetical protein